MTTSITFLLDSVALSEVYCFFMSVVLAVVLALVLLDVTLKVLIVAILVV